MAEKKLAETLKQLHASLADQDQVDSETRQQLETLSQDIQRILDDTSQRDADSVEPVVNDLKGLLVKLETEHPYTAGLLNRLAEALANIGI